MEEGMRDTICANPRCGRWTHILTPGGRGKVYCSETCRPATETKHTWILLEPNDTLRDGDCFDRPGSPNRMVSTSCGLGNKVGDRRIYRAVKI
jgi:hypothetical protein